MKTEQIILSEQQTQDPTYFWVMDQQQDQQVQEK